MPAAAKKNTAAGARAAALYFLDAYSYAMRTGDHRGVDQMCTDLSDFCTEAAKDITKVASGKVTYSGGQLDAKVVKTFERDSLTGAIAVDLKVDQARIVWTSGGRPTSYPASSQVMRAELLYGDGIWHVLTLTSVDRDDSE